MSPPFLGFNGLAKAINVVLGLCVCIRISACASVNVLLCVSCVKELAL